MIKVALVGKAGSGKTTVAEYLRDNYGFKILKIADPMYELAREYFNMTGKDRALLQCIGQKWREIDSLVWINYLIKRAERELHSGNSIVIEDCRLLREFDSFKDSGFKFISVSSSDSSRLNRLGVRDGDAQVKTLNDKTELEVDSFIKKCDYSVSNDSDIDCLRKQVDSLMVNLNL